MLVAFVRRPWRSRYGTGVGGCGSLYRRYLFLKTVFYSAQLCPKNFPSKHNISMTKTSKLGKFNDQQHPSIKILAWLSLAVTGHRCEAQTKPELHRAGRDFFLKHWEWTKGWHRSKRWDKGSKASLPPRGSKALLCWLNRWTLALHQPEFPAHWCWRRAAGSFPLPIHEMIQISWNCDYWKS